MDAKACSECSCYNDHASYCSKRTGESGSLGRNKVELIGDKQTKFGDKVTTIILVGTAFGLILVSAYIVVKIITWIL